MHETLLNMLGLLTYVEFLIDRWSTLRVDDLLRTYNRAICFRIGEHL